MKFCASFLVIFIFAAPLHAQTWLPEPTIRICENVVNCDEREHIDLIPKEIEFVELLLSGIPAKSGEVAATKFFGRAPDRKTPQPELEVGGRVLRAYRATWSIASKPSTSIPSHVDVYFLNEQAFQIKWWFNGMQKMVQLTYAK